MAGFTLTYANLKEWCQRQSYQFADDAASGQIAVAYQLLGQPAPLLILPQPARDMVMFVMQQPYRVPAERRAAVTEAAARLNATSFMGAWALNRTTGELFFRATLPVADVEYGDAGVLHVARVVVGTSEKAAPMLRAVALEGADPDQALSPLIQGK